MLQRGFSLCYRSASHYVTEPLPTVTAIVRGQFGRHAWTMQFRHMPRSDKVIILSSLQPRSEIVKLKITRKVYCIVLMFVAISACTTAAPSSGQQRRRALQHQAALLPGDRRSDPARQGVCTRHDVILPAAARE